MRIQQIYGIQLSLSLHFYLLYLLLNSCDGNDARHNVFSLMVALKTAGFSLADVQNDVLSPSRMRIISFSIDQQLRR